MSDKSDRKPAWLRNLLTTKVALVDAGANQDADIALFKSDKRCPQCRAAMSRQAYCAACGWTDKPTAEAAEVGKGRQVTKDAQHFADLIQDAKRAALLTGRDFNEADFISKASELFPDEARAWSDALASIPAEAPVTKTQTTASPAFAAIEKAAEKLRADDSTLTYARSIERVTEIEPELAGAYRNEIRAAV